LVRRELEEMIERLEGVRNNREEDLTLGRE